MILVYFSSSLCTSRCQSCTSILFPTDTISAHRTSAQLVQHTYDGDLYGGGIAAVPPLSAENIDPCVLLGTTLRGPMAANHRCRCARATAGASGSSATCDVKLERGSVDGRKLISSLHSDSAAACTRGAREFVCELEREGTPAVSWRTSVSFFAESW